MAMGSDYPHLLGSIERAVSSIADVDFPDAEKERIRSGTALAILNNVSAAPLAAPSPELRRSTRR